MTRGLIALGFAALLGLTLSAGGTETCFSKSEKVDGMNKICFYSCTSGEAAITIKSTQLCPLSIKR